MPRSLHVLGLALGLGTLFLVLWFALGAPPPAPAPPRAPDPAGDPAVAARERTTPAEPPPAAGAALRRDRAERAVESVAEPEIRILLREADGRPASGLAYWVWAEPPTFVARDLQPRPIDPPELGEPSGYLPAAGLTLGELGEASHLTVRGAADHLVTWAAADLVHPVFLPGRADLDIEVSPGLKWRVALLPVVAADEAVAPAHEERALVQPWSRGGVDGSLLRLRVDCEGIGGRDQRVFALVGEPFLLRAEATGWELKGPELAVAPQRLRFERGDRAPALVAFAQRASPTDRALVTLLGADGSIATAKLERRHAGFRDGLRVGMHYRLFAIDENGERLAAEVTLRDDGEAYNVVELEYETGEETPLGLGLPLDAGGPPAAIVVYAQQGVIALERDQPGPMGYRPDGPARVVLSPFWKDAEGFGAIWSDGRVAQTRGFLHEPYLQWLDNPLYPGIALSAVIERLGRPPEGVVVVLGTTRLEPVGTRWHRLAEIGVDAPGVMQQILLLRGPRGHLRLRFEGPDEHDAELPLTGW